MHDHVTAETQCRCFYFMPDLPQQGIITSRTVWAATFAGLVGALWLVVLSLPFLDHVPAYDEMYHILAARGLLATGQPVIGEGLYTRGELFTWIVAGAFRLWGESLVSARIPSLVAACLLVGLIGAWTTRKAGLLSGLCAAGLLAAAPMTIDLAVMARFYTLHALAIAILLLAGFEILNSDYRTSRRVWLLVIAVTSIVVALLLQITTVVAMGAGVLGGAVVVTINRWKQLQTFVFGNAFGFIVAVVAIVLLGSLAIWKLGFLELMGEAPKWAEGRAGNPGYYLYVFSKGLPLLFPLLPISAVSVIAKDRHLGVFCAVVIVSALAVHSISASKADRYVYYLLPFMSILWGCCLGLLVDKLQAFFGTSLIRASSSAMPLAVLVVVCTAAMSQEGRRTAQILLGKPDPASVVSYYDEGDWSRARTIVQAVLQRSDKVIVSAGVKALYFLGDYDLELNASVVSETDTGQEFGTDTRTGRQVIGTAASLAGVLSQASHVLVMVENKKLGFAAGVPAEVVALLDSDCSRVNTGADTQITAWECER